MSLEVYINDQLLDLKSNKGIGLTFHVGSILNISGRSGNLSNKFTVPKTQNNTKILGTILNINTGTNIPYQRNSGRVVQNGVELFPDGLAIVESSGSSYSITIYSGNVSFFDLIKGRNISDLDWSSSNHKYDIPTVIASFTNNSDYIYPMVDWGNGVDLLNNTNLQNSDALLPCARISSVLEKMTSFAGYELKGTFKNSNQYERLILSPNKIGLTEEETKFMDGSASDIATSLNLNKNVPAGSGTDDTVLTLDYQVFTSDNFTLDTYSPNNFTYGVFTLYYLYTSGNQVPNIGAAQNLKLNIREDGIIISTQTFPAFILFTSSNTHTSNLLPVYPGRVYKAEIVLESDEGGVPYIQTYGLAESVFTFTVDNDLDYDQDVIFSRFFDWGQDKFLKDILNQYCLTIQTNEITKQVFLTPLDDIILNLTKQKDWSNKIDLKKEPLVKFRLSGYAQTNYFNYASDDNVEEDFGQGFFNIDDNSLKFDADIIILNSSAVVSEERIVNQLTPTIPFMKTRGQSFSKKNSRHLLLDPLNTLLNLNNTSNGDTGSTSIDIPFCYFRKVGKTDNLDFQSLLDENYIVLQGMTDKIKFISANFLLSEVDVQNLDFTIPIFLDVNTSGFQANGFFYINKISNFKENQSTKVDLIRL